MSTPVSIQTARASKLRLAILGCGTIVHGQHLPAAVLHPDVEVAALVDAEITRAERLRAAYRLNCQATNDYRPLLTDLDAVINALPNHLHFPVNLAAMQAGVHVLCEKPLAMNTAEAKTSCDIAKQNGVILAVGMSRRFQPGHQLMELLLQGEELGRILEYDWESGGPWSWKPSSGFYFSREQAGGGVFMDIGVHALDCLFHWFGAVTQFEYQDDNWGSGIEANAVLHVVHDGPHGQVRGRVRLSRTFTLKNRLLVTCEQGTASLREDRPDEVTIDKRNGGQGLSMTVHQETAPAGSPFYLQLDNFVQSVRRCATPLISGEDALAVAEFVERCYASPKRIPEPWSEIPQLETARGVSR